MMTQNQDQKYVAVSFKQDGEAAVQLQLLVNGQQVLTATRSNVLAGALHCIGTEKLYFHFNHGDVLKAVEAEYPLQLESAFELVEQTDGFETKTLMQLIKSSLELQNPPTARAREDAVWGWGTAQRDLPAELVVNDWNDLPENENGEKVLHDSVQD